MKAQVEQEATPGPWEWLDFGNDWCLVSRTRHVPVVLAGNDHGRITTRDADGVLQPITPDHPNARLIATSPELLAQLKAAHDTLDALCMAGYMHLVAAALPEGFGMDTIRAAVFKAEGKA